MMANLRLCFLLGAGALIACGNNPSGPAGGDDQQTPDATVTDPPANGFRITTPDITIMPNQEITYCYYLKTPNTKELAIKKWSSTMTPGSHHMILFTTSGENPNHPPGSAPSTDNCGVGTAGANNIPVWTYSAQNPVQEMPLPADDGAGKPVGMMIPANQNAYIQMHYNNQTDQPIVAHVVVDAEAYPDGTAVTQTNAFVTFNGSLDIPSKSAPQTTTATQTCNLPTGTKFWTLSTHAHKHATHTEVKDGATMMFASDNWEHPGAAAWNPEFHSFGTNKLTYSCTYLNESGVTIHTGDSANTDEMCMAVGYFFPATGPKICYDGFVF